jgi:hypothetical protein
MRTHASAWVASVRFFLCFDESVRSDRWPRCMFSPSAFMSLRQFVAAVVHSFALIAVIDGYGSQ